MYVYIYLWCANVVMQHTLVALSGVPQLSGSKCQTWIPRFRHQQMAYLAGFSAHLLCFCICLLYDIYYLVVGGRGSACTSSCVPIRLFCRAIASDGACRTKKSWKRDIR